MANRIDEIEIAKDLTIVRIGNVLKLFTKEDGHYFHFHKIVGLSCLAHYIYRGYLVVTTGSMGFDDSWFTLYCILLHMLLHLSSFIFKISNVRNASAPIIYPEARWHSMIFGYRSFILMIIMWFSRRNNLVYPLYIRGFVVLVTMALADYVTAYYKNIGTVMRGMPISEYISADLKKQLDNFYAICQFLATMQMIFSYNLDSVFIVAFPIQISMFLMTLVRKSIITSGGWHFYYTMSLLTNVALNLHSRVYNPIPWSAGYVLPTVIAVTLARFYLHKYINKYVVWTAVWLLNLYCMRVQGVYTRVI